MNGKLTRRELFNRTAGGCARLTLAYRDRTVYSPEGARHQRFNKTARLT